MQSLETSRLIASRQRLVDLSAQTERLLESSLSRLERQRAIVRWLEQRGYPSDVARSLFMKMAEIVVTLQCQKAWLDKHLRESEYLELEAQPLPLDEIAPANLAARVHQQFLLELAWNTTSVEAVANGAWLEMVVHRVMASH